MSETPESFDAVIVGLGPAGILASHELIDSPLRVLAIDRSAKIGGAAFATDVNLQNITGFPPQSDFGERTLGSREFADRLVCESYEALHSYGLPYKADNPNDVYSYAVDEPTLKSVVSAFRARAETSSALTLRLQTTLDCLEDGAQRRWRLSLDGAGRAYAVQADHVVLATGKLSAIWLTAFLDRLGIEYRPKNTFALGFRVEGLASTINRASNGCENPKIRIQQHGVVTETFCWCKNGAVMGYEFGGACLLDGEHFYGRPQSNSSFGVITNVDLPPGASNTVASVAFSRYISALGEGRALLQRLGDFRNHRPTDPADLASNSVRPSLAEFNLCDLRAYFPSVVVDGFLALLAEINARHSGAITDDALVYAPILERIFPEISLTRHLETSREGLYIVGDCSGKGVGVAPAVVMGLAAARWVRASGAPLQTRSPLWSPPSS